MPTGYNFEMETNKQVDFDFVKLSWLVVFSFDNCQWTPHSLAKNEKIIISNKFYKIATVYTKTVKDHFHSTI